MCLKGTCSKSSSLFGPRALNNIDLLTALVDLHVYGKCKNYKQYVYKSKVQGLEKHIVSMHHWRIPAQSWGTVQKKILFSPSKKGQSSDHSIHAVEMQSMTE